MGRCTKTFVVTGVGSFGTLSDSNHTSIAPNSFYLGMLMRIRIAAVLLAVAALIFSTAVPANAITYGNRVGVTKTLLSPARGYVTVYNAAGSSAVVYHGGNSRYITGFYNVQGFRIPSYCRGVSQWSHVYPSGIRINFKTSNNSLVLRIVCSLVVYA